MDSKKTWSLIIWPGAGPQVGLSPRKDAESLEQVVSKLQPVGWILSYPATYICKESLLEQSYVHLCIVLFLAVSAQQNSWVVETETIWPAKLNIWCLAFYRKSL